MHGTQVAQNSTGTRKTVLLGDSGLEGMTDQPTVGQLHPKPRPGVRAQ